MVFSKFNLLRKPSSINWVVFSKFNFLRKPSSIISASSNGLEMHNMMSLASWISSVELISYTWLVSIFGYLQTLKVLSLRVTFPNDNLTILLLQLIIVLAVAKNWWMITKIWRWANRCSIGSYIIHRKIKSFDLH